MPPATGPSSAHTFILCRAIRERRIVAFEYDGGVREVEPHCHGVSAEGRSLLRGFQVGGYSRSGQPRGWKMFRLDAVPRVTLTERSFDGPRDGYDPDDKTMVTIYCRL